MAVGPVIRLADTAKAMPAGARALPDERAPHPLSTTVQPLAPASRNELVNSRSARVVRLLGGVVATAISLYVVAQFTHLGRNLQGWTGVALWAVPIATVLLVEVVTDRGASNPAADLVNAVRSAMASLGAMLFLIPATVGGSGLRVGLYMAAVSLVTRWCTASVGRTVVRQVSRPATVVALCDDELYEQLSNDLGRMRYPIASGAFAWNEVFPEDLDAFRKFWLRNAGKVWDPSELVVVFSPEEARATEALSVLSELENLGARVISVDHFYEVHLGRTRVSSGEEMLLGHRTTDVSVGYLALKEGLDLFVGLAGLALLLVVAVPVALLVRLTSKGPVLYRQERLGLRGRRFTVLKFRTMRTDAEPDGPRLAVPGDDRITSAGRVLRKTRLDELPQVWNILRRDMSLVGPRPERPEIAAMLTASIPAYGKRLLVRPGLTGWAQVNERYAHGLDEHRRKLERDLYYVRHRSATLDLQCVARTVRTVVRLEGR